MKPPKKRSTSKKKVPEQPVIQEITLEPVVADIPAIEVAPTPRVATVVQEEKAIEQDHPIKQPLRLALIALLLGWVFDFLFWEQKVGINFPIFLSVCLLAGSSLLFMEGYKPSWRSLTLALPFVFFAAITFVRREPLTVFLAFTFALFSIGVLATSYQGGRWYSYRLSDYVYKFLLLVSDLIVRPFRYFRIVRKTSLQSADPERTRLVPGLMRGLAIAVPIVLCLGSLLASADVVFSQKIDEFFDGEKILEYTQRLILIILSAYVLAGVFLHAATKSRDENVNEEKKSLLKPFLGFTESAVVLGSVIGLFLIFVIVQFRYFFGGETNIGVNGYTYSQYARRGFNELVTVAFFSLIILIALGTITKRQNEIQRRVYSILSVAVVALVMVILVSAFERISLAIGWHGYSRLRIYPRIFLIWLGLLLIAVAVLEIIQLERYFTFATVLAALGFAATLTLFNVDAAIVKLNVYRSWHGRNLNVPHLASLSTDAIPALADEFLSHRLPTSTQEGVGAILACYKYAEDDPHVSPYDWRSFNYSDWQAHLALEEVRSELAGYTIIYKKWPVKVRTPHGVSYQCWTYDAADDHDSRD